MIQLVAVLKSINTLQLIIVVLSYYTANKHRAINVNQERGNCSDVFAVRVFLN